MSGVGAFYHSSLGKKVIMAVTGAMMVLFVVSHMAGNLKIFVGLDPASGVYAIDAYAEHLRALGEDLIGKGNFLWLARAGLLAAVVLHVLAALQLRAMNVRAKPVGYQMQQYRSATLASRGMLWGGRLIFLFIVLHILHFTTGQIHFDGFVEGKVYANVHAAFQHWYWTAFYVAAMAGLGLHLYHGTWSMMQTLGIDTPRWNDCLRLLAKVVSLAVFFGFISVPVAIFSGLLPAPRAANAPIVSVPAPLGLDKQASR
jgi:succinate dehydrogenase / fumarate reductase cytochrome b subunit